MAKDWLKAHPGGVYEGAYEIEFDRKSEQSSGLGSFVTLTPSRPRRSNRRPKHVFYSSTAYTVHSPV